MRFRHFFPLDCARSGAVKDVAFLKGWGASGRGPVGRFLQARFAGRTADFIARLDSCLQACRTPRLSVLAFGTKSSAN